jgi:ADP-ribose pyrophosphatase
MTAQSKGVEFEGKYLRLVRIGTWEYAERTKASGAVVIVGLTPANRLILTEQFRIPVNARVVEFPAGLAGDEEGAEKEELTEAARRELREETGYDAGRLVLLAEGPPSAGLSSEMVTFFMAEELRWSGKPDGEGTEEIEVYEIEPERLDRWLEEKRKGGALIDPKVYAGLYLMQAARSNR